MSWVSIDDGAPEHRKFLRLAEEEKDHGAAAITVWWAGLCYANRQKARDGFIPNAKARTLWPFPPKVAADACAALVRVELWKTTDGGFRIHDYTEYQLTAEKIAARQEARREAGKIGGQRSGEVRRAKARDAAGNDFDRDQRTRAAADVALAIKRGDLLPESCEVCGTQPAQAHHDDYGQPLAVRWLCKQHHDAEHVTIRRSNTFEATKQTLHGNEAFACEANERSANPLPLPLPLVPTEPTPTPPSGRVAVEPRRLEPLDAEHPLSVLLVRAGIFAEESPLRVAAASAAAIDRSGRDPSEGAEAVRYAIDATANALGSPDGIAGGKIAKYFGRVLTALLSPGALEEERNGRSPKSSGNDDDAWENLPSRQKAASDG